MTSVLLGVSNFGITYLERLLKEAKVVPAVNQVELPAQQYHAVAQFRVKDSVDNALCMMHE